MTTVKGSPRYQLPEFAEFDHSWLWRKVARPEWLDDVIAKAERGEYTPAPLRERFIYPVLLVERC